MSLGILDAMLKPIQSSLALITTLVGHGFVVVFIVSQLAASLCTARVHENRNVRFRAVF